ncbi:MAG: undecaprenyl-diphosphatase [Halieaceae bacterium]|jgi:undecaprenyl-diphosphatase
MDAILLGIVQGFTEFLPVSSSGHLVIAQNLLGVSPGGGIVFEVALHLATLLAIMVFYRSRVGDLFVGVLSGRADAWRYTGKLLVATLPAVAVALLLREWIESHFSSLPLVGGCLMITGCIVWTTRFTLSQGGAEEPGWRAALLIGTVQAIAILPGISRSGSTVAAALALGMSPLAAAEFSFMLGMIAMAGAGVLLLPELSASSGAALDAILIGGVAALVSGLLALWAFVWLLRTQRFYLFAWYAWGVGALTLTLALVGG